MNHTNNSNAGSNHDARKLRVDDPIYWKHHRGGWKYVTGLITEACHNPHGVRFISAIEDAMFAKGKDYTGPIKEPWVGFSHQVPNHRLGFPDLERLLTFDSWKESLNSCIGIWTLTEYQKRYLQDNTDAIKNGAIKIERLYYPAEETELKFSFERFLRNPQKKLLFLGAFLRNFQAAYDIKVSAYQKVHVVDEGIISHMKKTNVVKNDSVHVLERVSADEYDRMLVDNIVFLNLFDAVASTTVVECITRGTPLLINRVGALAEYLGEDYPLFYDTLEEASAKAENFDLLKQGHISLLENPLRPKLTGSYFVHSLKNSSIYSQL